MPVRLIFLQTVTRFLSGSFTAFRFISFCFNEGPKFMWGILIAFGYFVGSMRLHNLWRCATLWEVACVATSPL